MGRTKRGSVDYSSATDVEVGYSSAASNSTFIPPYQMHHGNRYVSPTVYEQSQISPQGQIPTTQQTVPSPEYTSPGVVIGNSVNGSTQVAVAQNNSTSVATTSTAQYRRAPPSAPPVPLACTECRLRHLKCDAGVPTCGRCRSENRNCCYVKSRRGWKGRKRKGSGAVSGGVTSGTEASANEKGGSGGEGVYVGEFGFQVLQIS